jgi:hypothetical protein
MEKFFMIIILCVYGECNGMWQNTTYATMNECLAAAPPVKEYFMSTYPESTGQIYCLIEEEFNKWKKKLESGNTLDLPNKSPI